MWLFVAEIFCIYALAAILTFKETRTVAFVTSGGSFIFPIIAIYVAVALVTFLAQTSNLTLKSAFELGWIATVVCIFDCIRSVRNGLSVEMLTPFFE